MWAQPVRFKIKKKAKIKYHFFLNITVQDWNFSHQLKEEKNKFLTKIQYKITLQTKPKTIHKENKTPSSWSFQHWNTKLGIPSFSLERKRDKLLTKSLCKRTIQVKPKIKNKKKKKPNWRNRLRIPEEQREEEIETAQGSRAGNSPLNPMTVCVPGGDPNSPGSPGRRRI